MYGHETIRRVQQTAFTCRAAVWTLLEPTTTNVSTEGNTTPLSNRVFLEIYNKGQAATAKLFIYLTQSTTTPTVSVKLCKAIETGAYHMEPVDTGTKVWARPAAATARVIVTEYGQ